MTLGKFEGPARGPGLILIAPVVSRIRRVSLRIVTMPIQSQGIITKDNVSIDVSAVAYYRVKDPVRAVVAIENVEEAISQIAQTTLRAVVGRHTLDETLSETDVINQNIREILDVQTEEWGVEVTVVELRDIQLPENLKRVIARQAEAEAEREKRAKIIAAQGEALAAGELAGCRRRDGGPSAGAAAAQPPDSGRGGGRQKLNRRLPRPTDEHDRRARRVPGTREQSRRRASRRPNTVYKWGAGGPMT